MPQLGRPLSVVDAIKFARQAYYDGDSSSYGLPSGFDVAFLLPYLRANKEENGKGAQLNNILKSFVDSTKQTARISVSMADVGSAEMPKVIDAIKTKSYDIFDTARYDIKYTGTSIVFLEGSKFIINSLRDSIIYAFLMIFACMIFLFRNGRIVLFSILSNIIPIIITAGIMGWFGIALKPSTVLVFSVALGITVDVTIRFLVAFKQELPKYGNNIKAAVAATMHDTGMSIIYTSLILIAGFLVFAISQFDGTKALGYLTSITLLLAMFINLTILPALLVWMDKILLKKTIDDPLWEVLNEEEDIDLDKLKLE
jgi:predicted RND superfamily exporter protein